MPYLPDGTPVDIILNPLGVPSRMNVGQLYECLLGFSGDKLNRRFKILPFDEMYKKESSRILISKKLRDASIFKNQSWIFNPYSPGKMILTDGRTGNYFENPITVGKAYMLKLIHLVDDKIHARSTGPYSLVTQQPLGGKSRNGGQRFGEMEVWALEAYGAAHTLQELFTVKSDDMAGRNDLFAAILNNEKFPSPGIPESFKVLLRELQSMGLDINTYKMNVFGSNETYVKKIDLMKGSTANLRLFSPVTNDINLTF
jgi:DNA-directed RNA polymerase subunit beta